jgi:hypothetical protein
MQPFPSIEQAYGHVCQEALWQAVMSTGAPDITFGAVLATKGLKLNPAPSYVGAVSNPHPRRPNVTPRSRNTGTSPNGLKCSHCGKQNHMSDTCFKKMAILTGGMNCRPRRKMTELVQMQARARWL